MKIAVPDLISNSYLPAPAAVELGFFEKEGLDMTYELIFPVDDANKALRDGTVDFVGGSAHSTLAGFPEWEGAKLVCALSQGMYWFLVARKDLNIALGDAQALKGLNIGAAPWVDLGLRALLKEEGIDPDKDVNIAPIPGTVVPGVSFGVTAAAALEAFVRCTIPADRLLWLNWQMPPPALWARLSEFAHVPLPPTLDTTYFPRSRTVNEQKSCAFNQGSCKDALACVMWDACAGVCHGHCSTSRIPTLECSNLL